MLTRLGPDVIVAWQVAGGGKGDKGGKPASKKLAIPTAFAAGKEGKEGAPNSGKEKGGKKARKVRSEKRLRVGRHLLAYVAA